MDHESYMRRCFDLARLGAGSVSPNPMVGALLVYEDRIIGEGFHKAYGEAHAEVMAVNAVSEADRPLIPKSRMYVSLEPCCIFGRTPPCTNLILNNQIKEVVISCLDLTPGVAGQSVQILRNAGVKVITDILAESGKELARIRNSFVQKDRPYIVIKLAQSADGFIGVDDRQVWLTNAFSKRLVHKWRAESDAILVGTNTAAVDNPGLTVRDYPGNNPIRIILDRTLRLSLSLQVFDQNVATWVVTEKKLETQPLKDVKYMQLPFDHTFWPSLFRSLKEAKYSSLFVEGGSRVVQDLFDNDFWDEARIFTAQTILKGGVKVPSLPENAQFWKSERLGTDKLDYYRNLKSM